MKRIITLVLVACLILPLLLSGALADVTYPTEGVTNEGNVRLRKSMSTKSSKLATFKKGQKLTIEGEEEDADGVVWYSVTTPKGKQGYVLAEFISVPDTEAMDAANASSEKAAMTVNITASCDDFGGLGKGWTKYYELNGATVAAKKGSATLAPDVEFSLLARVKKGEAIGQEKMTYTPTASEIQSGFTVIQTVVGEHKAKGKSAEWSISYTFTPKGVKAKKETTTTTSGKKETTTTSKTDKEDTSKTTTTTSKKSDEDDIVFDLGTKSGDKPTGVVERKIAFYADREVEVTKRIPDGTTSYYVYETDDSGTQVQVEKTRTKYKTVKETVVIKNAPVYQDEIDNGTYVPLNDSASTSDKTDKSASEDEESEDEDVEVPEEEEEEEYVVEDEE